MDEQTLRRISVRGIAALMARLARRVAAVYFWDQPEAKGEIPETICRAVGDMENFARGGGQTSEDGRSLVSSGQKSYSGGNILCSIGYAARSVHEAGGIGALSPAADQNTLLFAKESSFQVVNRDDSLDAGLANDCHNLLTLAPGPFPLMGNPIDPSEQGPLGELWPHNSAGIFSRGRTRFEEFFDRFSRRQSGSSLD